VYSNILIYIEQDATLHSLFYLETALHVSGSTITHHQEHKQLYLQHLLFVTPLLLSASIVEELELVWVCCGWRTILNDVHGFNLHGSVYRKNILIYIQQDATLHSLFYLKTALHVSGGTITHHQERKQLYLQHLLFVTLLRCDKYQML